MSADDILKVIRKDPPVQPMHLNVRLSGEDVTVFQALKKITPGLINSQRQRDSHRLAALVLTLRAKGTPVLVMVDGKQIDLIDYVGVFVKEE